MRSRSATLRRQIIKRAQNRCEYCPLSQASQEATFHIDHVVPLVAGGPTTLQNLALACVSCSLRKGARRVGLDPQSQQSVPLFSPRTDRWYDHFRWEGVQMVALTPTGRATLAALQMNRPLILAIRHEEQLRGRHPPAVCPEKS